MTESRDPPPLDLDALAEAYERGLARERAGDVDGAVAAFARALALDPDDRGGVAVRLAALGRGETPPAAPPAYVATLFDQTAERFDDILVEQLGYAVPLMLRDLLAAHGIARVGRLLDLGCGTGLTGESLRAMAEHVTGCDLSEGMVEIAWDRGAYDDLYVGEAVAFLQAHVEEGEAPFDLIAATDVLPYLGEVGPLFEGVRACLAPGGIFGFSTETLPDAAFGTAGYRVGPKHRFAHARDHLRAQLAAHDLGILAFEPITVRHDEGQPVPGHLILARG